MGIPYKKLQPGQTLDNNFSATVYNDGIDTIETVRHMMRQPLPVNGKAAPVPVCKVRVRNDSDYDVDMYVPLGITDAVIEPAQDDNVAPDSLLFSGVFFDPAGAMNAFALTVEPIKSGNIGMCVIPNAFWAWVDIKDANDTFCGPDLQDTETNNADGSNDDSDQEPSYMVSGVPGCLMLVQTSNGEEDDDGTGQRWVLCQFCGNPPMLYEAQEEWDYTDSDDGIDPHCKMIRVLEDEDGLKSASDADDAEIDVYNPGAYVDNDGNFNQLPIGGYTTWFWVQLNVQSGYLEVVDECSPEVFYSGTYNQDEETVTIDTGDGPIDVDAYIPVGTVDDGETVGCIWDEFSGKLAIICAGCATSPDQAARLAAARKARMEMMRQRGRRHRRIRRKGQGNADQK